MIKITSLKETKYTSVINSTIIDDIYIIPGLSGEEIDIDASFYNMQKDATYNEDKLVFNEINPSISIEDNKDKIIIRGNKEKRSVSLIFESVNELTEYLFQKNYKVNILITSENYNLNYEMINASNTNYTYNRIEKYLNNNKLNKNLCLVKNDIIPSLCTNKYLFKPSLTINHSNLSIEKNNIESGEIILVKDSLTLAELNILLNEINYKDLSIVPLSNLIDESLYN